MLISLAGFSQRSVTGDTLKISGGGSFGGGVKLVNSPVVDSILETIINSSGSIPTTKAVFDFGGDAITNIDASNNSMVKLTRLDGTFFYITFGHNHIENLLTTQLSDIAYNATTWNGNLDAATKNAIRDKIETLGVGSVTSVSAGNGMDFTTITGSGAVIMGTPTTLTAATTNAVQTTSHTHDVTGFAELQTMTDNAILRANGTSGEYQNSGVIIDDNDNITGVNILTADSVHAVWFGGLSDFELGEVDSKITVDADSMVLSTSPEVQVGSNAAVSGDEVVNYITAQSITNPLIFTQTATVTITNNASELTLIGSGNGSQIILANTLAVGDVIRIRQFGVMTNANGSGTDDLTWKIKANATILASGTERVTVLSTDWQYAIDVLIVVRSIGAGATILLTGTIQVEIRSGGEITIIPLTVKTVGSVNTTINQTIDITGQWSGADPDLSVSSLNTTIEFLQSP